jgi:predicted nucleotidyltransferase
VNIIEDKSEEIREACKEHKVDALYAFGSVVSDSFSEESDIDLLVTFAQGYEFGAFAQYFDFKEKLEAILNRPVDLVCYQAIRNTVFKHEVDNTKRLLYAA